MVLNGTTCALHPGSSFAVSIVEVDAKISEIAIRSSACGITLLRYAYWFARVLATAMPLLLQIPEAG